MSGAARPEPVRTCIGCRQRYPQSALVRVTRTDAGVVADGPSDGRGAWLCRGSDAGEIAAARCVDTALARRAFARAWRRDFSADDERAISELVGRGVDRDEQPDAR